MGTSAGFVFLLMEGIYDDSGPEGYLIVSESQHYGVVESSTQTLHEKLHDVFSSLCRGVVSYHPGTENECDTVENLVTHQADRTKIISCCVVN